MARPLIVLFVGVPGSGKTTFAKALGKELGAVVLASDSMRLAMWETLEAIAASHADKNDRIAANRLTFGGLNYATEQIVAADHSVIYDCNANSVAERQEKHDIAKKYGALSVVVRMRVPYDVSLQRLQTRDATHDARQFSLEKAHEVLAQFAAQIEEPTEAELSLEIDGSLPFETQYEQFRTFIDTQVK